MWTDARTWEERRLLGDLDAVTALDRVFIAYSAGVMPARVRDQLVRYVLGSSFGREDRFGDALVREVWWATANEPARFARCREWRDLHDVCDANEFLLDAADAANVDLAEVGSDVVAAAIRRAECEVVAPHHEDERQWFVTVYDGPTDSDYQIFATKGEALALGAKWAEFFVKDPATRVAVYLDRFAPALLAEQDWCWWDRFTDLGPEVLREF